MLLVLLIILPLIGAIACAYSPKPLAKAVALGFSVATLVFGIYVALEFYAGKTLTFEGPAAASLGFTFKLGVNAISLWLMVLTVGITPLAIAASFDSIKDREKSITPGCSPSWWR